MTTDFGEAEYVKYYPRRIFCEYCRVNSVIYRWVSYTGKYVTIIFTPLQQSKI